MIKDDIAYIEMDWLDQVEDKYKPPAIAVIDTNTGRKEDFISIPSFNIFGQSTVSDKNWTKYEILEVNKFAESLFA